MKTEGSSDVSQLLILLSIAVIGLLAVSFVAKWVIADFKQEAIDRGFAKYNTVTGEWQWKEGGE